MTLIASWPRSRPRERLCFTLLLLRSRSPGGGASAPTWAGRPCPAPDERRQPCPRRSGCHQRSAFSALTIGRRRGDGNRGIIATGVVHPKAGQRAEHQRGGGQPNRQDTKTEPESVGLAISASTTRPA